MHKNNYEKYLPFILVAIVVFLFAKNRFKKGVGDGIVLDVGSSKTDLNVIKASANNLREIFANSWYYDSDDNTRIINCFRVLDDVASVKKLYNIFGNLSTTFYGSGDLDYWMSGLNEDVKVSCRNFCYGVSGF